MADIKLKNIRDLTAWNDKELRKLKITINNRISALESPTPKDLKPNHPLLGMEITECKDLLSEVFRAEKKLSFNK